MHHRKQTRKMPDTCPAWKGAIPADTVAKNIRRPGNTGNGRWCLRVSRYVGDDKGSDLTYPRRASAYRCHLTAWPGAGDSPGWHLPGESEEAPLRHSWFRRSQGAPSISITCARAYLGCPPPYTLIAVPGQIPGTSRCLGRGPLDNSPLEGGSAAMPGLPTP